MPQNKDKSLKEGIIKILDKCIVYYRNDIIADQIISLFEAEKKKWLEEKYPLYLWDNGKITKLNQRLKKWKKKL